MPNKKRRMRSLRPGNSGRRLTAGDEGVGELVVETYNTVAEQGTEVVVSVLSKPEIFELRR